MRNDFFTQRPTYEILTKKLQEMKLTFPFLKIQPIGKSVINRLIYAVTIGNQSNTVVFVGATHASEWLTTTLLIRYLEHISFAYREHTKILSEKINDRLNERGLTIIPMLNPDGVNIAINGSSTALNYSDTVKEIQRKFPDILWQANARGVDLNHNFDAEYENCKKNEIAEGITMPAPRQYGGQFQHSEPEVRTIVKYLAMHTVESLYTFHSQGEEIYWSFGKNTPPQSKYILHLLSTASGYNPILNSGLASSGGLKDYFIERYKKPAFTIEIGKGKNPLPITDLEDIYERVLELLFIATVI